MMYLLKDIKKQTKENTFFRNVLKTGKCVQVVIMNIKKGEEIGQETHKENDQILLNISGEGIAIIDGDEFTFEKDDLVLVPKGVPHNFKNTGKSDLKILTFYAPPHHEDGTIHRTKKDAHT